MIKGLIIKLIKQANEEFVHKGWCDACLSTTEQKQKRHDR